MKKINCYIENFITNNSYHLMNLICFYFTITVLQFHLNFLMKIDIHFDTKFKFLFVAGANFNALRLCFKNANNLFTSTRSHNRLRPLPLHLTLIVQPQKLNS